jgi:Spy/CpxP family protein refolding chaperone
MWMVLKQLDLTDQQKASVKQILQTAHTTLQPQMQTLKADRLAFLEATPGSSAYDSAATTLAQAASAAAQARVQEEASVRTQIYGLLSGPQQSKLATLQAEWAQKAAQHASTSD